jgi:TRAP-type transport system small permease protein
MQRTLLQQVDRAVAKTLDAIMFFTLGGLLILVSFVVITRVFKLVSAGWTDELIELLFAWLIFFGAANLWREKGHFAITLVEELVKSEKIKAVIGIVAEVLSLAFLLVFTYYSCVFIAGASDDSPVFAVSKAYWYVAMPVSGVIMIAYSIARLIQGPNRQAGKPTIEELTKYEV